MSVCIVGAGVSGLTCASVLHRAGVPVRVLEANVVPGGRVRSETDAEERHLGDLGASWVWPTYQPALALWLERLGVATTAQYERGDGCVERSPRQAPSRMPLPVQHGQRRPLGGPQAIVDALLASLPADAVHTGRRVVSIERDGGRSRVLTVDGDALEVDAVVVAIPLRVAMRDVAFDPPLPPSVERLCRNAPTWMAAQAKALIVYESPFWRTAGLSGRLSSTLGPLVESHDHCGPDAVPAALVGFVGPDAGTRERLAREHGTGALAAAVLEQLERCLGPSAGDPLSLRIEDWACDPHIATSLDIERAGGHPAVLPSGVRETFQDGNLQFAVAEVSETSPGLLEGAFVAGERAARCLLGEYPAR